MVYKTQRSFDLGTLCSCLVVPINKDTLSASIQNDGFVWWFVGYYG